MGEENKTLDLYKKASELPLDAYGRAKMDLLEMLAQVGTMGKGYRSEGEGIKAHIRLGPFEASFETIPQPKISSGGSSRRPRKKADPEKAKAIVQEYADLLTWDDKSGLMFVGTKSRLGDKFDEVHNKLKDAGFTYVRWVKDVPYTGGWKGNT